MVTIVFALLLTAFAPLSEVHATTGTRTGNLEVLYYSTPILAYGALKTGAIDTMIWPLDSGQYADAVANQSGIELGPVLANGMREFDLNNNETIAAQPGVNSPTSYWQFRAALALLTDKDYIVANILGGFGARMDVPVVPNAPSWLNTSVTDYPAPYHNYPWDYDPVKAAAMLDANGFIQGSTPNPYYDSGFPGSALKIRVQAPCAPVHDNPMVGTQVTGPPYTWPLTLKVCLPVPPNVVVMGMPVSATTYSVLAYTFAQTGPQVGNEIPISVTVATPLTVGSYLWIGYNTTNVHAGENLQPIIIYSRSDDPAQRLKAGNLLNDDMRKAGIPTTYFALPSSGTRPPVMTARNYHIYTGGWSLGRYPTSMYALYHTDYWFPDGSNYVNAPCPRPTPGCSGTDPNLDVYTAAIYYANSIPAAIVAAKKAEGIIVMKCVNIPLWCAKSFYAWRTWLLGVVNEMGYGPENMYTFMNAYKATGAPNQGTLILGMNQPPQAHNPLYSQWTYDYALLDRYWDGGQSVNPYDIGRDQPYVVQDWTPTTWINPDNGLNETACIYWLRKDVKWAAAVTGSYIRSFTAHDVEFSNMFQYFFSDGWNWADSRDIDHITIIDQYTFEVFFSTVSYWLQYAPLYPLLPKYEWGAIFCTPTVYNNPAANYAAGTSLIINPGKTHGVAQVQNITVNGNLFTNYMVRFNATGKAYSANRIYFTAPAVGNLVVNYWNITKSAKGFYPGSDTVWTTTSYSIGEWIPTDITKDTWAVFKRNAYYWMETPPLGEIDWFWYWGSRDTSRPLGGPRKGSYTVDIYDVVYATGCYGSTGYGNGLGPSTDPPWFPGADLAPSYTAQVPYGGEIDIYDVTSILVNYDVSFGTPP